MNKQLLLSIVLAIGVVAAGIWIVDQSLKTKLSEHAVEVREYQPHGSGAVRAPQNFVPADTAARAMTIKPPLVSPSGISKCIINGKTVYSDQRCPDGAEGRTIVLQDSGGIISPPKEDLATLTAKRKAAELAQSVRVQQQLQMLPKVRTSECADLDKRIESLDTMARQPQSPGMQDWIREERKALRDRQFAISC